MILLALTLLIGSPTLKVGDTAPRFTAADSTGTPRSLEKLLQAGPVVLAFYPKAFTPGCTKEMTTYSHRYKDLQSQAVTLLAVSGDDAPTLQRFRDELKADYHFIPDPQAQLMELYGVRAWPLKMAKRVTFLIKSKTAGGGTIVRIDSGDAAVEANQAVDFFTPKK
jgi:peroxiredoxin Q/BCP